MRRCLTLSILCLGVGLFAAPRSAHADIYTFTDANGVVHYSNSPPPQQRGVRLIRTPERAAPRPAAASRGVRDSSPARFSRYDAVIREAAALDIPMLGICFGSQILASALCGRDQVFRRDFCEIAYKALPVTDAAHDDPVCGGLGESVTMFVWHNDEVRADHPDMTIIAYSDLCPNHVWRYRDQPFWGIQGHPEITLEQAPIWFEENRERMERDGADIDVLKASAVEAAEAKTMLTRFAHYVRGQP